LISITTASPDENFRALREKLLALIRNLITSDLDQLFFVLYRMDVDEKKLRTVLNSNPEVDTAEMITDLIIEREVQKQKSRRQNTQRDNIIGDEEKW
jgi:hypothetical protein